MALDEPSDDDVHLRVAEIPFVMRAGAEKLVGAERDIRVEYLPVTDELYAATTLSATCLAWFEVE